MPKQVHVYLDAQGAGSGNADSSNLLSSPQSLKSLRCWQVLDIKHCLRNQELPDAAQKVLDAMCVGPELKVVVPDSQEPSPAWQSEGLDVLEKGGFLDKIRDESAASTTWELLPSAADKLCTVAVLGKAASLASARPNIPTQDMTRMELMLLLQERGFSFEKTTSDSKEEPPPFVTKKQGPKLLYLKAGASHFYKSYLLALAEPEKVNAASVRHCQPDKYYKSLLGLTGPAGRKGKKSGGPSLTLGFQDDTGVLVRPDKQGIENAPLRRARSKRPDPNGPNEGSMRALEDEVQPPPPPLPPPEAEEEAEETPGAAKKSRTDKGRSRNPKTHPWGAGRLTFKPPNSWQATCHRTNSHKHALGHTGTKCTRTRNFKSSAEEQIVLRQLRHWLNTAQDYGSRVAHMQAKAMPKADATRLGIDLELLLAKPPADYNSDPEGEEGIAIHDDSAEGPAGEAPASAASASALSSSSDSTSSSSGD